MKVPDLSLFSRPQGSSAEPRGRLTAALRHRDQGAASLHRDPGGLTPHDDRRRGDFAAGDEAASAAAAARWDQERAIGLMRWEEDGGRVAP